MLPKLNAQLFDWTMWRNGTPLDIIGVPFRKVTLIYNRYLLKKYAIGYCNGEELICRPKQDHKAVMYFKDNIYYWFHMTNEEFALVWR